MKYTAIFKNSINIFIILCTLSLNAYSNPNGTNSNRSLQLNELGTKAATQKRLPDAEKLFREALAVDRFNLSAAFNLASILLALDKSDEAIKLLEDYSTSNPKDAELAYRLGDAYFGQKKIAQATASYEKAFKLAADLPVLAEKLASIYSLQNKLDKAEYYLEIAIKQAPNIALNYSNLASVKLGLGKTEESIAHAKKSIQLSPTKQAYVTLGNAYEMNKDFKNSIIAFERAIDLGDDRKELKTKVEELKKTNNEDLA